jgi:hypothetical protein
MEPKASGFHTSLSTCEAERAEFIALKVLALKNTVPASCTRQAHHPKLRGSNASTRRRCRPSAYSSSRLTFTASKNCSAAAEVKKIEPMKKVTASGPFPTAPT